MIAAGGTAGHVLPTLAVAEALSDRGISVSFAGSARVERRLVTEAGFEIDEFTVGGIPREVSTRALEALGVAVEAPFSCGRILRRRRPDVVLGGGGYVGGPMVLAAGVLGIPAALTETDAHLGLANRLAAPFAKRVFLSYPIAGHGSPKYRVVGRPIPRRSLPPEGGRGEARRRFGLPSEGPVLLVCGGSQGASRLNEAALDAFALSGPAVLHLSGERDHQALTPRAARPDYRLFGFIDDFGTALAAADLVVSRAGGAVWEIAAAGKPAILVPYPHATADHQTKNARYFADRAAAVLVPEPQLDLRRQVEELLGDPVRLGRMSKAMRELARPDAAEVVAEELIALASAGR